MKITPEQRARIDSLYCERLSCNDVNFRLVDEFFNSRNTSISDTLKNEAHSHRFPFPDLQESFHPSSESAQSPSW